MGDMTLFNPGQEMALPEHLQGLGLGVGTAMMAAIGDSRNRIGLKGSRFRQVINGQETGVWDENYLDVIIVGVVPSVSRIYYAGKYKQGGDNAPPNCYSVDNVTPAEDVHNKESDKCQTCPQNVKGSKVGDDGHEGRACGFFRRMVIMLPGDTTLYVLDVKAQGIFGESKEALNRFSMNDYAKFLSARGVDASVLVTRLSFDTDVSVPKLLFKPERYLTPEEAADVQQVAGTNEIQEYLTINFKTIDLSKEQSATEEVEEVEEAAAPEPTPVQTPKPVQTAPKPQPKPTPVAQTPRPTPTPTATQQAPKPTPKPVAPTAPAKPKPTGPGKLVQTAKPAAAVTIDNNVPTPEVTEVGSPDDLKNIMAELGL